MKIESNKKIVEGKHQNQSFVWRDGVLEYRGTNWSMAEVKTLIELVTLLRHEELPLIEALPEQKAPDLSGGLFRYWYYGDSSSGDE